MAGEDMANMELTTAGDGELLCAFIEQQRQEAFAEIVRRHGALVLGVCRSVLGNVPDAEDAAQAVFLALVRKAASLKDRSTLAGWLHRVAWYAAAHQKRSSAIRARREREAANMRQESGIKKQEAVPLEALHAGLSNMPDKYRLPIILHHLEGRSQEEVARLLGSNAGAIAMRLNRGRQMLRDRLAKTGAVVSAAGLAAVMTTQASAAVSTAFVASATKMAACTLTAKAAAGAASANIMALSKGALNMLFVAKIKIAAMLTAAVLVAGGMAAGTYIAAAGPATKPASPATPAPTASAPAQPAGRPICVWWEAEAFKDSNWPGGNKGTGTFAPSNDEQKSKISGGVWLNGAGFADKPFLVYEIEVPADGEYTFWARIFGNYSGGVRTPFRYRFDEGAWVEQAAKSGTTLHSVKPQTNSTLAWVRFDKVKLTAGKHSLRVEVLETKDVSGFDCFVLSRGAFQPNGTLKPGEKLGLAMDGWCAFEPDADDFSPEAMLDLSYLNHMPAGKFGYVTRSPDGNDFFLDGKPIRFWSVELGTGKLELEDVERHARFLAKRGVNAVRYFQFIEPKGEDSRVTDIDEDVMRNAWKVVAAMKKHGIYTMITPIFTLELEIKRSWGLKHHRPPPGSGKKKPDGAFFVEPDLRAAYKGWMKKYLLTPNPYTGIPLAKDPAVYCIQVHNENSYFFYTYMYGCQPGALKDFGKTFGDWLTKKHGSLDKALAVWGGEEAKEKGNDVFPADDFANGIAGLPPHLYALSAGYAKGMKAKGMKPADKRMQDYFQFLAEHMYGVYKEMTDFYRNEIGYKGLISSCNWKSRDPLTLDDVERWTYTAGDVIDTHHYVNGGPHVNPKEKERAGYQVNNGDYFGDSSALLDPRKYATNFKMVAGYPSMISESTWVSPMSYQAEGPLVAACYGALTGLGMFNWFATGVIDWDPSMNKFQIAIPAIQGQFPATALIHRNGLVKQGDPAVYTERKLTDFWELKFPIIAEDPNYDPNQNSTFVNEKIDIPGGAAPLAFLVGPVRCKYDGDPSKNKIADLSKYIDIEKKIVKSITGELMTDYGNGLFTVNAPKAQGAAGFLSKAGELKLAEVTINSKDEYAAVVVVPLDDSPIASSKKLLVQVGSINRPYKWEEKPATFDKNLGAKGEKPEMMEGKEIVSTGRPPWNVRKTQISVVVRNPGLTKATLLDANGMPKGLAPCKNEKGELAVQLPPDALYVILH